MNKFEHVHVWRELGPGPGLLPVWDGGGGLGLGSRSEVCMGGGSRVTRSNASWVMVTWEPLLNERQTQMKT